MSEQNWDAGYFDAMLRHDDDPWSVRSRWYEERKRTVILASLPDARYRSTLEIGCSTGVLTGLLADRSDVLLALDVSSEAVALAQHETAERENVRVEQHDATHGIPAGPFDLIVLSEVAYYLTDSQVEALGVAMFDALEPDGVILACHWRHAAAGRSAPGDEVHQKLRGITGVNTLVSHSEKDFVLDVLSRTRSRSVAEREGIVDVQD